MNDPELPLWQLFTRLQAAGFPLGIGEYQAVLQALQGGFGIADRTALARLCCTVWVNSPQEKAIFDYHFNQLIAPDQPTVPTEEAKKKARRLSRQQLRRISVAALLVLLLGVGIWFWRQRQAAQIDSTPTEIIEDTVPENPIGVEPIPVPQDPPAPQTNDRPWLIFLIVGLAIATALAVGWWRRGKSRSRPSVRRAIHTTLSQVLLSNNTDAVQVAQAVQRDRALSSQRRFFSQAYFPVTRRQMKQSWRYLRRFNREGRKTELNVAATVQQIGRQGLLLEPVLQAPRVNRTELLLLIDTEGSMIPFKRLAQNLQETAVTAGRLRQTTIYYFHNCPGDFLYRDRYHLDGVAVTAVLANHDPRWTVVLIFSDAGAARQGRNAERIMATERFLTQLQGQFRQVVWVNPLPSSHWSQTTAQAVAQIVPMLELSQPGFQTAIDILRGRSGL